MKHVKNAVYNKFGVALELEVKLVGFTQNELSNLI